MPGLPERPGGSLEMSMVVQMHTEFVPNVSLACNPTGLWFAPAGFAPESSAAGLAARFHETAGTGSSAETTAGKENSDLADHSCLQAVRRRSNPEQIDRSPSKQPATQHGTSRKIPHPPSLAVENAGHSERSQRSQYCCQMAMRQCSPGAVEAVLLPNPPIADGNGGE